MSKAIGGPSQARAPDARAALGPPQAVDAARVAFAVLQAAGTSADGYPGRAEDVAAMQAQIQRYERALSDWAASRQDPNAREAADALFSSARVQIAALSQALPSALRADLGHVLNDWGAAHQAFTQAPTEATRRAIHELPAKAAVLLVSLPSPDAPIVKKLIEEVKQLMAELNGLKAKPLQASPALAREEAALTLELQGLMRHAALAPYAAPEQVAQGRLAAQQIDLAAWPVPHVLSAREQASARLSDQEVLQRAVWNDGVRDALASHRDAIWQAGGDAAVASFDSELVTRLRQQAQAEALPHFAYVAANPVAIGVL